MFIYENKSGRETARHKEQNQRKTLRVMTGLHTLAVTGIGALLSALQGLL